MSCFTSILNHLSRHSEVSQTFHAHKFSSVLENLATLVLI